MNLPESPLSWLHARGYLDDRQFAASERLRTDYERAQLVPSVMMRWDSVRAHTTGDTGAERQVAAKVRFHGALAQAGGGLQDVLWRVICAGETMPAAEKALEWPARSG